MGTLLNNIRITRTDANGNTIDLLKVPITYAPKDKMLARIMQDPALDRPTATAQSLEWCANVATHLLLLD